MNFMVDRKLVDVKTLINLISRAVARAQHFENSLVLEVTSNLTTIRMASLNYLSRGIVGCTNVESNVQQYQAGLINHVLPMIVEKIIIMKQELEMHMDARDGDDDKDNDNDNKSGLSIRIHDEYMQMLEAIHRVNVTHRVNIRITIQSVNKICDMFESRYNYAQFVQDILFKHDIWQEMIDLQYFGQFVALFGRYIFDAKFLASIAGEDGVKHPIIEFLTSICNVKHPKRLRVQYKECISSMMNLLYNNHVLVKQFYSELSNECTSMNETQEFLANRIFSDLNNSKIWYTDSQIWHKKKLTVFIDSILSSNTRKGRTTNRVVRIFQD